EEEEEEEEEVEEIEEKKMDEESVKKEQEEGVILDVKIKQEAEELSENVDTVPIASSSEDETEDSVTVDEKLSSIVSLLDICNPKMIISVPFREFLSSSFLSSSSPNSLVMFPPSPSLFSSVSSLVLIRVLSIFKRRASLLFSSSSQQMGEMIHSKPLFGSIPLRFICVCHASSLCVRLKDSLKESLSKLGLSCAVVWGSGERRTISAKGYTDSFGNEVEEDGKEESGGEKEQKWYDRKSIQKKEPPVDLLSDLASQISVYQNNNVTFMTPGTLSSFLSSSFSPLNLSSLSPSALTSPLSQLQGIMCIGLESMSVDTGVKNNATSESEIVAVGGRSKVSGDSLAVEMEKALLRVRMMQARRSRDVAERISLEKEQLSSAYNIDQGKDTKVKGEDKEEQETEEGEGEEEGEEAEGGEVDDEDVYFSLYSSVPLALTVVSLPIKNVSDVMNWCDVQPENVYFPISTGSVQAQSSHDSRALPPSLAVMTPHDIGVTSERNITAISHSIFKYIAPLSQGNVIHPTIVLVSPSLALNLTHSLACMCDVLERTRGLSLVRNKAHLTQWNMDSDATSSVKNNKNIHHSSFLNFNKTSLAHGILCCMGEEHIESMVQLVNDQSASVVVASIKLLPILQYCSLNFDYSFMLHINLTSSSQSPSGFTSTQPHSHIHPLSLSHAMCLSQIQTVFVVHPLFYTHTCYHLSEPGVVIESSFHCPKEPLVIGRVSPDFTAEEGEEEDVWHDVQKSDAEKRKDEEGTRLDDGNFISKEHHISHSALSPLLTFIVEEVVTFQRHRKRVKTLNRHFGIRTTFPSSISAQLIVDALSFSFFTRRLLQNPSFYGVRDSQDSAVSRELQALREGQSKEGSNLFLQLESSPSSSSFAISSSLTHSLSRFFDNLVNEAIILLCRWDVLDVRMKDEIIEEERESEDSIEKEEEELDDEEEGNGEEEEEEEEELAIILLCRWDVLDVRMKDEIIEEESESEDSIEKEEEELDDEEEGNGEEEEEEEEELVGEELDHSHSFKVLRSSLSLCRPTNILLSPLSCAKLVHNLSIPVSDACEIIRSLTENSLEIDEVPLYEEQSNLQNESTIAVSYGADHHLKHFSVNDETSKVDRAKKGKGVCSNDILCALVRSNMMRRWRVGSHRGVKLLEKCQKHVPMIPSPSITSPLSPSFVSLILLQFSINRHILSPTGKNPVVPIPIALGTEMSLSSLPLFALCSDVCSLFGTKHSTLRSILMTQAIVQCVAMNESALCQIPHITETGVLKLDDSEKDKSFDDRKYEEIEASMKLFPNNPQMQTYCQSLVQLHPCTPLSKLILAGVLMPSQLIMLPWEKNKAIGCKRLGNQSILFDLFTTDDVLGDVCVFLKKYPVIRTSVTFHREEEHIFSASGNDIEESYELRTALDSHESNQSMEFPLNVYIERHKEAPLVCSPLPILRREGWYIVVCYKDEVLMMRRKFMLNSNQIEESLVVPCPEEIGRGDQFIVDIYILSDSYVGFSFTNPSSGLYSPGSLNSDFIPDKNTLKRFDSHSFGEIVEIESKDPQSFFSSDILDEYFCLILSEESSCDLSSNLIYTIFDDVNVNNLEVSSLEGFQHLLSVFSIHLSDNSLNNIDKLASLTKLGIVDLSNNLISDLSPLQYHNNLHEVSLSGNTNIFDISQLYASVSIVSIGINNTSLCHSESDSDYVLFLSNVFPSLLTDSATISDFILPSLCSLIDSDICPDSTSCASYSCSSNENCPSVLLNEVYNPLSENKECAGFAKESVDVNGDIVCYSIHDDSLRNYFIDVLGLIPEDNGILSVPTLRTGLNNSFDIQQLWLSPLYCGVKTLRGLELASSLTELSLDGYDLGVLEEYDSAKYIVDRNVIQILSRSTSEYGLTSVSLDSCGIRSISDIFDLKTIHQDDSTTIAYKITSINLDNNSISDLSPLLSQISDANSGISISGSDQNCLCDPVPDYSSNYVCRESYPNFWVTECAFGYYLDNSSDQCVLPSEDEPNYFFVNSCFSRANTIPVLSLDGEYICQCREGWKGSDCSIQSGAPYDSYGNECGLAGNYDSSEEICSCVDGISLQEDGTCMYQVYIPDDNLRKSVCFSNDSNNGGTLCDISMGELTTIEKFSEYFVDINDLNASSINVEGVQYMVSASFFDLNYGTISDLTPINELKQLTEVYFSNELPDLVDTIVSDISPLSDIYRARFFHLTDNSLLSDISMIYRNTGLHKLKLDGETPFCHSENQTDFLDFISTIFPYLGSDTEENIVPPKAAGCGLDCDSDDVNCPSLKLNQILDLEDIGNPQITCSSISKEQNGNCHVIHDDNLRAYLMEGCEIDHEDSYVYSVDELISSSVTNINIGSISAPTTLKGLEYLRKIEVLTLNGYDLSDSYDQKVVKMLSRHYIDGDLGLKELHVSGCNINRLEDILDFTVSAQYDGMGSDAIDVVSSSFKFRHLDISENNISDLSTLAMWDPQNCFGDSFNIILNNNNICDFENVHSFFTNIYGTDSIIPEASDTSQNCHCSTFSQPKFSDHEVCRQVYQNNWQVECWVGYYFDVESSSCLLALTDSAAAICRWCEHESSQSYRCIKEDGASDVSAVCRNGLSGPKCTVRTCPSNPDGVICGSGGTCDLVSNTCICDASSMLVSGYCVDTPYKVFIEDIDVRKNICEATGHGAVICDVDIFEFAELTQLEIGSGDTLADINSIVGIENLYQLGSLSIYESGLTDINSIYDLPMLNYIGFYGSNPNFYDLSPIKGLFYLSTILTIGKSGLFD
ncbi:Small heat shock protein RTM2-like protein, partial [Aduncisulcus paluster]